MNKHLRKICLLTAGILLLSVFFCFSVSAVPAEGIYTYSVTDGEAKIMKVSASASGELTTPQTLGGYPVTAINGFAFGGCTSLTKVTISEGVRSLGYGTFNGCTNLATIDFPDSLRTVEYEALSSTKWYSLQPEGVVYADGVVIGYKGSMPANSTITFRKGTKAIASGALKDKTNIVGISFPEGFEAIGTEAFSGCFNLKSLTFPESLKTIGSMAFFSCTKIPSVTITENVTEIGFYAFDGCSMLGEIVFDTVNEITDNNGFFGCENVEAVRFTKDAKSFAPTVLECGKLKTVTVESGNTAFSVDADGVLYNADKTVLIKYPTGDKRISYTVPSSVKTIAKEAFKNSSYLSIVNIPSSVETIEERAFEGCKSLTTVKLEKGVETVGDYAFSNCEALASITLPDSLMFLGKNVFSGNVKLQTAVIPEGLTEIPDFTFFGCSSLKNVTIPSTVTRIGWSSFNGCTSLMSITLPDSVTEVTQYAFDDTGWYNSLADGPAYLGRVLYKYKGEAASNSTVTVKDGTELIANGAFAYNDKILKVVMPSTVKTIGDEAFCGNYNLTYVTFGSATESIGDRAFSSCPKLASIIFPQSLKTIGDEAFRLCPVISSVIIPKSLEKIGACAFGECGVKSYSVDSANPNFTAVNGVLYNKDKTVLYLYPSASTAVSFSVPAGVKEIGEYAFWYAEKLSIISIPSSVEKAGKEAFEFSAWLENKADGVIYAGSALYKYKGDVPDNTTVTINDGTVGIAEEAFLGQGGIYKISFPDSLKYIGKNALERTEWLTEKPYGIVMAGKVIYCYKGKMPENTVLTVEDAVSVADAAFTDCGNLTEVTLGKSVASLGEDAFSGCNNLGKLTVENAQCEINPSKDTIPSGTKISAPANSTAQKYAESQGNEYITFCYHSNTTQVAQVNAGCTEPGFTAGVYCNDCQKYISGHETIAAKGHTEADVPAVEASCNKTGLTAGKKCSQCGTVLVAQTVTEKTAHTEEKLSKKEATCTETGLTEGKKCSVCGEILVPQGTISAKGHSEYTIRGTEPSCTEAGLSDGKKCSVCGAVTVAQTEIPALGHSFVTSGSKKICNVCGFETDATHTHTEVTVPGKNASCTETGLTEGKKCSDCGEITLAQKTIPATGHTEVALPAKSATYKVTGLTAGKKCSVCGTVTVEQKKTARKKLKKVTSLKVKKTTASSVTLSWKKVTGADSYKVYYSTNGKKWKSVKTTKTALTVKKLTSGKNYQFKVRAFAGKYYGAASSVVKTATRVKKVTLSSVKSVNTAQATVSWKTVSGAGGYVVEYSTSKKFKNKKTVTLKKGTTKKATLKKLKSGKKYYVRVRAYKTVNGKKAYGSYSSVKTVTVK